MERRGRLPVREWDTVTLASAPYRPEPSTKETDNADDEKQHRDAARAERVVHRGGLYRRGRRTGERDAAQREQCPLRPGRTHGVARTPERPDDLGDGRRRPRAAARRWDRGDPPRRPRLLRAGRGALARRRRESLHDAPRAARGR